jgi:SAM-dependent methyltransferase
LSHGDFEYDATYFERHYASPLYRRYVVMRNQFIWRELTQHVSAGRFLEIGFADDNLIRFFRDDFDVFGIDLSQFAVQSLPQEYAEERFAVCDVAQEPIPFRTKFDVICAVNTVEHLADPMFALRNIGKALKPGGILGVYLPTASNLLSEIQYRLLYDVEEHIYRPSVGSLRRALQSVGLTHHAEYAASFMPLKVSHPLILKSLNLYFGVWAKVKVPPGGSA